MRLLKLFIVIVLVLSSFTLNLKGDDSREIVFAMCRPLVSNVKNRISNQIKNIEHLYERDIIPLRRIKLIAIYHEDEVTDYEPAHEYVKENNLDWVTFEIIKGKVKPEDLFKENQWTEQFKAIFAKTAGIVFTGGMDFPPALFGEPQHLLSEVETPVRSAYEVSFLFHLLGGSHNPGFVPFLESRPDYAILGICLGSQTMNVACGGTLYQDIPMQVYGFTSIEQVLESGQEQVHSSRYIKALHPLENDIAPAFHHIKLKKGSLFVKQMNMKETDTPYILSSHHQAMNQLGAGLEAIATSMDGKIIEAIEHKKYKNVLGIQFHPEPYWLYQKGAYFRKGPGEPLDFNLRSFLEDNPPAMEFHKKIWQWFSRAISR
jgi:putative glutamine amidotransferase